MNKEFKTIQRDVVLPTSELIKMKGSDFRVLSIISVLSEGENNITSGESYIYTSHKKFNSNIEWICKILNMNTGQVIRKLRSLLKHKSDEFRIVEKEVKGEKQHFYEIKYKKYQFVNIPYEKLEKMLIHLNSNCLKLYCNLLWLCVEDGEFVEKQVTQSYLLELMGLSKTSTKILKSATDSLIEQELIRTRREWLLDTKIVNGISVNTIPKEVLYYSIVWED